MILGVYIHVYVNMTERVENIEKIIQADQSSYNITQTQYNI